MTISTNDQKVNTKKFNANFDAIFGAPKPVQRGSFTQTQAGVVPREKAVRTACVNGPMVMKPLQDFVSPIDQTVISTRGQLKAHNERHGVANSSDFSEGYVANRARARNEAGEKYLRETRRSDINSAINRFT
jgi:hypothetical protein